MAVDPSKLFLAMGLSFLLIVIIIACANCIYYFGRQHAIKRAASQPFRAEDLIVPPKHFILLRVLLDGNEHASLSTFQFLAWTLVISFLYITLWFLGMLTNNITTPPTISPSLMAIMGISVAIPLASQGIASYKQFKPRQEGETYIEPDYASMLEENGRPSLLRLQMFLWTFVAITIYVGVFFTSTFSPDTTQLTLGLGEIDSTLLFLMGLSATGYLGNQAYSGKVEKTETPETPQKIVQPAAMAPETVAVRLPPVIRETIPRDIEPKGMVTLLGSGFGTRQDTIMIGEERIPSSAIGRWEDTRIEFTLPETASPGSHNLRVISGGELVNGQISVSGPVWTRGLNEIDANILGDIWIDDPSQKGYRLPPIGYFIPDKRYYFFFEFEVPPGTPPWGRIQFRAKFFLDSVLVATRSFLPGTLNGQNYGNFDYVFTDEGKHHIEITGSSSKSMDIEVKKPPDK